MTTCPRCGGVLERTDAVVHVVMMPAISQGATYIQPQPRVVLACTSCEYISEKVHQG